MGLLKALLAVTKRRNNSGRSVSKTEPRAKTNFAVFDQIKASDFFSLSRELRHPGQQRLERGWEN